MYNIVGGTNYVLNFTVGAEESSGAGVVKLTAVVTLDGLNGGTELSFATWAMKLAIVGNVSDFIRKGKVYK